MPQVQHFQAKTITKLQNQPLKIGREVLKDAYTNAWNSLLFFHLLFFTQ